MKERSNWQEWKYDIQVILDATELMQFAEDKVEEPAQLPSDPATKAAKVTAYIKAKAEWDKKNAVARKIIVCSLDLAPKLKILGMKKAPKIWSKLKKSYDETGSVESNRLIQQWFDQKRCPVNDDIDATMEMHITKPQNLFVQLNAAGEKISKEQLMTRFILTLPVQLYHFACSWDSEEKKNKNFDYLVSRIMNEFKRFSEFKESSLSSSSSFFAGSRGKNSRGGYKNHWKGSTKSRNGGRKENESDNENLSIKCYACENFRHISYDCPNNKKCNKNRNKSKNSNKSERDSSQASSNEESEEKRSAFFVSRHLLSAVVKQEGSGSTWYLDSGASDYFGNNKKWFLNYENLREKSPLILGDGRAAYAVGKGIINVLAFNGSKWEKHFLNALYVPDLGFNLFSMGTALKGKKMEADKKSLKILIGDKTVVVGEIFPNTTIYEYNPLEDSPKSAFIENQEDLPKNNAEDLKNQEVDGWMKKNKLKLWHERLGYQNYAHVKQVLKNNNIKFSDNTPQCEGCIKGKMH